MRAGDCAQWSTGELRKLAIQQHSRRHFDACHDSPQHRVTRPQDNMNGDELGILAVVAGPDKRDDDLHARDGVGLDAAMLSP